MSKQSKHIKSYRGPWAKASRTFLKANPRCQGYKCDSQATHTDHIIPHEGNKKKFWDKSNWQGLCWACHNRKTQGERVGKTSFDEKGRPTDPSHFWNRRRT